MSGQLKGIKVVDLSRVLAGPLKFSKTPVEIKRHPPLHGEHTEELLLKLGYLKSDIVN
jgi:crotonobetainyl-CoA:carnitine CoA-transferase CaiB-like acyl-CoA transferase